MEVIGETRMSINVESCAAQNSYPSTSLVEASEIAADIPAVPDEDGSERTCESRPADAWHGFFSALLKLKSSSHTCSTASSTATPDAPLSEVGSSHGGFSPRRWADEEIEADTGPGVNPYRAASISKHVGKAVAATQDEGEEEMEPIEEPGAPSPSKRSRRGNRRRRTRGKARVATNGANAGISDLEGCAPIEEEVTSGSLEMRKSSQRDVVVLSDLCLGLDSPAIIGVCPSPSKLSAQAEFSGSPCHARAGSGRVQSTRLKGVIDTCAAASDASARDPASSHMQLSSPDVHWADQASPCRNSATPLGVLSPSSCQGFATFPGFDSHTPGSTAWSMQTRLQDLAPSPIKVGTAAHLNTESPYSAMLSSPCRGWSAPAGGIVSTSPMSAVGPSSPAGATFAGAGSRSADTLRSWLYASGLPSTSDLVAQLQAAAPEVYED